MGCFKSKPAKERYRIESAVPDSVRTTADKARPSPGRAAVFPPEPDSPESSDEPSVPNESIHSKSNDDDFSIREDDEMGRHS
jgi:hypothetical protein